MNPEIEIYGNTASNVLAGHAYVKGEAIAAVTLHLPKDFWLHETNNRERGRPKGANKARLQRDIEALAAHDIVQERLKRDGQKATADQKQALVLAATGASRNREFNDSVNDAAGNERQFRRRLSSARKELSDFLVKIDVGAQNPKDWTWAAISKDGRAWLYLWGAGLIECAAQQGNKPGSLLLKPVEHKRTK